MPGYAVPIFAVLGILPERIASVDSSSLRPESILSWLDPLRSQNSSPMTGTDMGALVLVQPG